MPPEPGEAAGAGGNSSLQDPVADSPEEAAAKKRLAASKLATERLPGDQTTRFFGDARAQVWGEFAYLAVVMLLALGALLWMYCNIMMPVAYRGTSWLETCLSQPSVALIVSLFLSGMLGGAAFDLKWLYHTVAKNTWFKDRMLWRVSVPWMGGLLGVFANFIFARTLGTAFDEGALDPHNLFPACGLAFLIGVFADGVLASLEKLAIKTFGTLNDMGGP